MFHIKRRNLTCFSVQRAALDNMTKVLKGAGVDRTAVVKCNVFLTNLPRDFAPMNEVYLEVRIHRNTLFDYSLNMAKCCPVLPG